MLCHERLLAGLFSFPLPPFSFALMPRPFPGVVQRSDAGALLLLPVSSLLPTR